LREVLLGQLPNSFEGVIGLGLGFEVVGGLGFFGLGGGGIGFFVVAVAVLAL
jgi:hypothetical protein